MRKNKSKENKTFTVVIQKKKETNVYSFDTRFMAYKFYSYVVKELQKKFHEETINETGYCTRGDCSYETINRLNGKSMIIYLKCSTTKTFEDAKKLYEK